jgi:hypothetical protein
LYLANIYKRRVMMTRGTRVYVVDWGQTEGPVAFGRKELLSALDEAGLEVVRLNHHSQVDEGHCLVIGTTNQQVVRLVLAANCCRDIIEKPETVLYHRFVNGAKDLLVIAGTDERGLMYGLLEMADRVRIDGKKAIEEFCNQIESPDHAIRGVDRFIMGHLDEEWYFSEDFWHYYLGQLARRRFNRLTFIAGFDTEYMSPPYPFFVHVPTYPSVGVRGLSDEARARNLEQLRRIGALCKEYGIEFIFGTWQQTPWTTVQELMVEGLPMNEDELSLYCRDAITELLNQCPEIDGIHFRVNHESGVGGQESNEAFWKECINGVANAQRKVRIELRAKGLTEGMIQHALEHGLDVTVPTKHWCEHTGLPHHLTQMRTEELTQLDNFNHSRRYSYADMLKKPMRYDLTFRLWNYGSTCLFLWGDPDYVRRFSHSCDLGSGFTISAPLSLMGGYEKAQQESGPWNLFDDPELAPYRWIDERYWLEYILFGRIGYSRATSPEVWQREFRKRFGNDAALPIERALRSASKILPLITASHMPVHPSLCYWPEISTGAALFAEHNHEKSFRDVTYITTEPSDPGLFYKICDYVDDVLKGTLKAKYTPLQVRRWLLQFATETRTNLEAAQSVAVEGKEFKTTELDLLMLADLAEYHASKILAAVALSYYQMTNSTEHLIKAYCNMKMALDSWTSLANRGDGTYHRKMDFGTGGTGRAGHWLDRLPELQMDLSKLAEMLKAAGIDESQITMDCSSKQSGNCRDEILSHGIMPIAVDLPCTWTAGMDLRLRIKPSELARSLKEVSVRYRRTNQLEGEFKSLPMRLDDQGYCAVIPGEYITPEWDLMVYFSAIDDNGNALLFPGLYNPDYPAPYHIIKVCRPKGCKSKA